MRRSRVCSLGAGALFALVLAVPGSSLGQEAAADLAVTLTGRSEEVGQTFTFTATVRNDGPATAAVAIVRIDVPPQFTFLDASGPVGGCAQSCHLGSIAPNEQRSAQFQLRLDVKQETRVRASASSSTTDPDPTDNEAGLTVFAPRPAALAIDLDRLPPAQVGKPYSAALPISGGTPPYSVELAPCSNPVPGLSVTGAGVVSSCRWRPGGGWDA